MFWLSKLSKGLWVNHLKRGVIVALSTSQDFRSKVIYEVYVRNHMGSGKFSDVKNDIERIKQLGCDIVWLMPVYPVGYKDRKGKLGSPYSISDYCKINDEYGTIDDFRDLIEAIHNAGMLVMIDIVFNHTSKDSQLFYSHPEYFMKNSRGEICCKVPEWSDVYDLDYSNNELWIEQINALKFWMRFGIDGFRCDVASLVPLKFWIKARKEVEKINENIIWLSETVHPDFIQSLRNTGFNVLSDSEIYNVFDITYDYDVRPFFEKYLKKEISLREYIEKIKQQEYIYPYNYVKLRLLENHDLPRIKSIIKDYGKLKMWTAFTFFEKGAVLIYAGQEVQSEHEPGLFDRDMIDWKGFNSEFPDYLKRLSSIKKLKALSRGNYNISCNNENIIYLSYSYENMKITGIFNVEDRSGFMKIDVPDGKYKNLIDDSIINIKNKEIELCNYPVIFESYL